MANGGSYLRLTRKAEGFDDVGENSQAKLDALARAGSSRQRKRIKKSFKFLFSNKSKPNFSIFIDKNALGGHIHQFIMKIGKNLTCQM